MAETHLEEQARRRLRSLFQFMNDWHQHQVDVPRDWRSHSFSMRLLDLPPHPYIEVGRVEGEQDSGYVLRVRRPDETPCPKPPQPLRDWLLPGWRDPTRNVEVLPSKNETVDGDTVTIRFEDDPTRPTLLVAWRGQRDSWRVAEAPIRAVLNVYHKLFELRGRLGREEERLQFVLGQGMLRGRDERGDYEHPLLLQRARLEFKPDLPQISILLADDPPELNTSLLRNTQGVDARRLAEFRDRIRGGDAHLQDDARATQLLTELIHALFGRGKFVSDRSIEVEDGVAQVFLDPVLLLIPRNARYQEAIQASISRLDEGSELPIPLVGIVGVDPGELEPRQTPRSYATTPRDSATWSSSDVRRELFLTKPANEAQENILRQLRSKRTVVVQGPPGTGKTHTIGNIVGHLLAEGKRVLIASHTSKALRVLRENIVESLRPLCVSVLDDDGESRRQLEESVHGITRRLSEDNVDRLEREAAALRAERERLIDKLEQAEAALERAISDEYTSFVVAGRPFEPSEAAKLVRTLGPTSAWIPGSLTPSVSMPLDSASIRELYDTNAQIETDEEDDIDGELPEPQGLPTPEQFADTLDREATLRAKDLRIGDDVWLREPTTDVALLMEARRAVKHAFEAANEVREHPHLIECLDVGRRAGPARETWDDFVVFIDRLGSEIAADEALKRRRTAEVKLDRIDETTLAYVRQIRAALKHEKTVFRLAAKWGNRLHPLWRRLIDASFVEGRRPANDADWEAVEALVRMYVNRDRLLHRWRGHFDEHRTLANLDLGPKPESACTQHLDRVRHALSWHADHWSKALAALEAAGISIAAAIRKIEPRTDRFGELNRLVLAAQGPLKEWVQKRLDQLELGAIERDREQWRTRLRRVAPERDTSGLARGLLQAIEERDRTTYGAGHERLIVLERKRSMLLRRRGLLGALAPAAPDWAGAIMSRQAPHDQSVPPGDPEKAWLYRQLLQELERRGSVDIAMAQSRVTDLRAALVEATSKFVDRCAWAGQHRRTKHAERQALQGWLIAVQTRGYQAGIRSAQLKAQARRLLSEARNAVPVWIMTLAHAVDSLDFQGPRFDVVIVDEASQCDLLGMLLLGIAKEAIVVGDDKQVSPSAVGEVLAYTQKLIDEHLRELPTPDLFTGKLSLYDIANQSFRQQVRLTEHFRSAEDIIAFSNHLSYGGTIRPLRDTSTIRRLPHVLAHRVAGGQRRGDVNPVEALEVASLVVAALEQPEYRNASVGVISLLKERQAVEIERVLIRRLSPAVYDNARILCGAPPQFQGDERDVVFLSMVDSGGEGLLTLRRDSDTEKRYNVAASRARDQMWVVHSLDPMRNLQEQDLRSRLLRHIAEPGAASRQRQEIDAAADSEFERQVGKLLTDAGYRVKPQWRVGSLRIDLVVVGAHGKRAAIECDGDRYHTLERLKDDLDRQMVLERLPGGWRFIRIRGTEFFRDPAATMDRVMAQLTSLGVEPLGPEASERAASASGEELRDRVVRRAADLRKQWAAEDQSEASENEAALVASA